ncbi:NERD domain-containing protein [Oryzihumus sp.]|uniref:NERD domain-containing protein n=1 Tax=Oryzihumus sp. TaxID=1968903 RepID=UPI002EDB4816
MHCHCDPAEPLFTTESERHVWETLRDTLRQEDRLLANLRLTDHTKDHEADLVVLMPGAGVVVVEVKGGSVHHDGHSWQQTARGETRVIDPVRQVRDTQYALRRYVESDPRWKGSSRGRVRWGHAVVVPWSDVDEDFALPDCPRWSIHGKGDMDDLAGRLWDVPRQQEVSCRVPDEEDCALVAEILRGRHLPQYSVVAEADERESRAQRLTLEQAQLLQVTRLLPRVEVRGGAGSGKTVLALEQARQLTCGGRGQKPQRVALVCYSRGLAAWFQRVVEGWPRKQRPAFVGTFHQLGRSWGAPDGSRDNSEFWESELPRQMAELARGLPDGRRFDAVIVDESQDFAESWWAPILGCLRDEERGGIYAYTDENQRIFARFGGPPVPLVPLVLDHNLRNTRQIGEAFNPLAPMRMRLLGGNGPDVTFVAAAGQEEAVDRSDEQVEALLDEGWRPRDVALLVTGHRHPVQIDRGADEDPESYWRSFWEDDDVFYGHVLGCKGLERRAVVLCVNHERVRPRDTERLYVGLSRATDRLVVVGDPALVREIGGPVVASRLGI